MPGTNTMHLNAASLDPRRLFSRSKVAPARDELPTNVLQTAREHYIPLRKIDLVQKLASDESLELDERAGLTQMAKLLEATLHHQYHDQLEALKHAYSPFDPDAEARPLTELTADERVALSAELFDRFTSLLERANFRRLSAAEIEASLSAASDSAVNVQVDLNAFAQLEVFVRGDVVGSKVRRRPTNFYRLETVPVPTYQRLAVIFRLKPTAKTAAAESAAVTLKLFKNIPKADIEMLLPGTRVRMTLFDQGKILLPTLSGVAITGFKLLQGAANIATAGMQGLVGSLGLIGGTVGYGVKSFLGYVRTRDKYQHNLTRSLYYQNLDNNAGVLFRLLDEAEEQEFRETLLAWWLLRDFGDLGATSDELDEAAERWLLQHCGLRVDFEISDALDKLFKLGMAHETAALKRVVARFAPPRFVATDIATALETLDRVWDNHFSYNQPRSSLQLSSGTNLRRAA